MGLWSWECSLWLQWEDQKSSLCLNSSWSSSQAFSGYGVEGGGWVWETASLSQEHLKVSEKVHLVPSQLV